MQLSYFSHMARPDWITAGEENSVVWGTIASYSLLTGCTMRPFISCQSKWGDMTMRRTEIASDVCAGRADRNITITWELVFFQRPEWIGSHSSQWRWFVSCCLLEPAFGGQLHAVPQLWWCSSDPTHTKPVQSSATRCRWSSHFPAVAAGDG